MSDDNNNIFNSDFLSTLQSGSSEITTNSVEYTSAIEKTKASIEQAKASQEFITALSENAGGEWPQVSTKGFLSPVLISPSLQRTVPGQAATITNGSYVYKDWRGQELTPKEYNKKTEDRFKLSIDIPKTPQNLAKNPYSMRDIPIIFNDYRFDYFKHGLQVIDNLNPLENPENGSSNARLSNFTSTPFENNDPVMFGFEIIIDAVSSPLLNGSVLDFINNYSSINEVAARKQVYEDWKQQFIKFFRTRGTVRINDMQVPTLSKLNVNSANQDPQIGIFWPGKKAYLGYYLKKVGGLDLLVENNKGDTRKYFADYKKDMITLEFFEDVSLSVATMAHLYKLLYWSKPNGKNIIPENLLRFNCDIIISECRNFQRTRKAAEGGNLEIIKDNLSRHIYSLRECQFYFDKMPHPNDVDLGGSGPTVFESYTVQFDYKYVTNKFERFVPAGNFGQYVGYNSGAIWKIGNPGERENRGATAGGSSTDSSIPKFFTIGGNSYNGNGVENPFVTKFVGGTPLNNPTADLGVGTGQTESLEDTKESSEKSSAQTKAQNEVEEIVNSQGSAKGSTLDLGKKSAEEAVKKEKDKAQASVASKKNEKLNSAIEKAKNQTSKGVDILKKNLQQRAENAALNARNQVNTRINQEKQKLLNTALNEARNAIQVGTSEIRKNLLDNTINSIKSSTPKSSGPTRQNLLNGALDKVRNQALSSGKNLVPAPPNPTQFFDVKGQLIDFAGPSLGGSLTGQ